MQKNIILLGATGKTGIQIAHQLQAHQLPYTAFVRKGSEQKLDSLSPTLFEGNVLNEAEVEQALLDQTYTDVIIALGSKDLKDQQIRFKGTQNIIRALQSTGQKATLHIISANGVGDSWNTLSWMDKLICKLLISKTMKDHGLQEEAVIQSGYPYHIIRPVALSDDATTGKVISEANQPLPHRKISRGNLAKYLVDSLVSGKLGIDAVCNGEN